MKKTAYFFLIFIFSLCNMIAQTNKEKIASSLNNFYQFNRESIHLHLNKTIFTTSEKIWFKGYILNKSMSNISLETTNVYVSLIDSKGKTLYTNLYYANEGKVDGQIEIDKNLDSGKYYLQTYTNYMNNFNENESTIQEIEIINTSKNTFEEKITENNEVNLKIDYEGGNFIYDSYTKVVVTVKNCFGQGVELKDIQVLDEKNNIIKTFSTNKNGLGNFDLLKPKNEKYTIKYTSDKLTFLEKITPQKTEGYNLIIDNYSNKENFFVEIKSNDATLKKDENKELILLIQKDRASRVFVFKIQKNYDLKFTISKKELFEGINTLRLIDQNLNQVSERIIFNQSKNNNIVAILSTTKNKDSITIIGKLKTNNVKLSLNSSPLFLANSNRKNSIIKTLSFDNNLKNQTNEELLNFNDNNFSSQDLDLFLITNSSKYSWESIINNNISEKYNFEKGIDLTITFDKTKLTNSAKKLKIFSLNGISETININSDSEFQLNNVLATDSLSIHYSFPDKPELVKKLTANYTLKNNKSKFLKPMIESTPKCNISYEMIDENSRENLNEKVATLENIEIEKKIKPTFIHRKFPATISADAYKITELESDTYTDVLSFIASHQYDVLINGAKVEIITRDKRSWLGNLYPVVLLNNNAITNHNELLNLKLIYVDEIYINNRGAGMGNDGMNGVISIFTKKGNPIEPAISNNKKNNFFYINDGFENVLNFTTSISNFPNIKLFEKYGSFDFINNLNTNDEGIFEIKTPHFNQEKILINIQGIDNLGQLYNENIEVEVK